MLIDQETGANSQPLPMSIAALTIGAMNHSDIPGRLRRIDNLAEFSRRSGLSRRTLHSVMNPERDIRKSKIETLDEIAEALARLKPATSVDTEAMKSAAKAQVEKIKAARQDAKAKAKAKADIERREAVAEYLKAQAIARAERERLGSIAAAARAAAKALRTKAKAVTDKAKAKRMAERLKARDAKIKAKPVSAAKKPPKRARA